MPDDEKAQAIIRKLDAEAEAASASAVKSRAEAEAALRLAEETSLRMEQAKINLTREQRKEREELASDKHHFVYSFTDAVNSGSVRGCISQLTQWSRNNPGCDMEIIFNSPGGSVIDGMALFDFIMGLRRQGHHVTTLALGYAASMAGILLQVGDKRTIGREAYILIHEISFGAGGKIGEVEDEVAFVKKIQERVLKIFALRCAEAGQAGTAAKPFSLSTLKRNWRRKDWWLSSEEALAGGLVDEVR